MDMAMNEIPLALFTTLAPLGAGAFISLAVAYLVGSFNERELAAADKFTLIPLLFGVVGLVCSFAHLTNPMNALNVANTIGQSHMANEITAFGLFMVAAALFWILGICGKLSVGARKVFGAVVGVLALVFCFFVGAAYMLDTIPVWNTAATPLSIIGFALFGGVLLGLLVLSMAGAADSALQGKGEKCQLSLFVIAFVLALVSVIAIWVIGSNATSAVVDVAANAGSLIAPFVVFIVLAIIGFGIGIFSIKLMPLNSALIVGVVVVCLAVFCARICFYGMQIGIGL